MLAEASESPGASQKTEGGWIKSQSLPADILPAGLVIDEPPSL